MAKYSILIGLFRLLLLILILDKTVNLQEESPTALAERKELIKRIHRLLKSNENLSNEILKDVISRLNRFKKSTQTNYPIVVNTWPFVNATAKAWETLVNTDDPVLAVIDGCSECEGIRCDGTVGIATIHTLKTILNKF